MPAIPGAIDKASITDKSVEPSLWWDSFSDLLSDIENVSPFSDLPPSLAKKLEDNNAWFLGTVSFFKPPNEKSREALDASQINVGSHKLPIHLDLKETAVKISSVLGLDEIQSYILVKRWTEHNNVVDNSAVNDLFHMVMLDYYIERQCLLKCIRQVLVHALYVESGPTECYAFKEVVRKLISDGLESRLLVVLQELLSSSYPEHMDVGFFALWAEEMLVEDNLVLDILFLVYYESFCTCMGKEWKTLCLLYQGIVSGSYNFGKLAISNEAICSIDRAKVQLLLILIETLDLETILQMLHDETPFRQGSVSFSLTEIQEIDVLISSVSGLDMKEAGALILAWAVFLCLILSLPGREENNALLEINHVGYVHRAFEAASLTFFLEILRCNLLKYWDGPLAGYRCVLRTFISAFIASYEISLQPEDSILKLILDIICEIYRGEESLCIQFWDKESFIDGPIRCLLCNLEGEFPFRIVEFVSLLSALCEGSWPAECVYNFLHNSVGLSTLFKINDELNVDGVSWIVETRMPLRVPDFEGLIIPERTAGHVLKVIDRNTSVVRWEYKVSGLIVLLLRLAQRFYMDNTEEIHIILDLLSRLVTFNTAVCFSVMDTGNSLVDKVMDEHRENNMRISSVEIICSLVKHLPPTFFGTKMMALGVNILTKMLICSPFIVSPLALKACEFDVASRTDALSINSGLSSVSWSLSGRITKMLQLDCEHSDSCCELILSVMDFTMQLVAAGAQSDSVLDLISFSFHYVLVNHEFWKYKVKYTRWKVTLKVLEVVKKCISKARHNEKLGEIVWGILLSNSSIHNALFRIVCLTSQDLEKIYVSRQYELIEIEGLQLALCFALEILYSMLSDLSKDTFPSVSVFHQVILSSTMKPIPVITALISLMSFFRNPTIQIGAARVLRMLFFVGDCSQGCVFENACFGLDDKQLAEFRNSVNHILYEQHPSNEELIITIFELFSSAACFQPAFLASVLILKDNKSIASNPANNAKLVNNSFFSSEEANLLDIVVQYIARSEDLIVSKPKLLLSALNFLKALWQESVQFTDLLEGLRNYDNFWRQLTKSIFLIAKMENKQPENMHEAKGLSLAYRYQCQTNILQIVSYEIFIHNRLSHTELLLTKLPSEAEGENDLQRMKASIPPFLNDIFFTWCEESTLGDLIKSLTSGEYNYQTYHRAKVNAGLFALDVMTRLKGGVTGCLSVSLIEKLQMSMQKLTNLPAFSELSALYSEHGYGGGKELHDLILSDFYYYLEGVLDGRDIHQRQFKELSEYLLEHEFLLTYRYKYDDNLFANMNGIYLFDSTSLGSDLRLDLWEGLGWKASKVIGESMLLCLEDFNSMVLVSNSRLFALKALISIFSMCYDRSAEKNATIGKEVPQQLILSGIDHIRLSIHSTLEALAPVTDGSKDILNFVAAQCELLLHLIRSFKKRLPLSTFLLLTKASHAGLKILSDIRHLARGTGTSIKLLLMLLLSSVETICCRKQLGDGREAESVEAFAEASNMSLGLLPILFKCIEPADHFTLALSCIDLILKSFSTPATWFPVVQKHLYLPYVIQKLQDKNSLTCTPAILKFLLTLAKVREGAKMLLNAGFLASLRVLNADLSDGSAVSAIEKCESTCSTYDKVEKPNSIWGLGLAVVTAMLNSLGDTLCHEAVDYLIAYLFIEKTYLIFNHLNAPEFPPTDDDKKRARLAKTQTSLGALAETENTLMLMCMLAKHPHSWFKVMKEMDSKLREGLIHLLAFISHGDQYIGKSPRMAASFLCHPVVKEEIELCKKPPFINSKNGWFALSPSACILNQNYSKLLFTTCAPKIKDQSSENTIMPPQTHFSDLTAIQMYRIAFLLLRFLCMQAGGAAKRAEEVGFVDLAHFPELPMPGILHSLQDQCIAVVTELCENNKLKQVSSEVQGVCILLLQITLMALYLEFCVLQICGIRPVMGRTEEFSKEAKELMRVTEGHAFLKESMKSVRQITCFLYPGLLGG